MTNKTTAEQNLITHYGECLAAYRGRGVLTVRSGQKVDCTFEAGQLTNGSTLLLCDFPAPSLFSQINSATAFDGITSEGYSISAEVSGTVNYLPDVPADRSSGEWVAFRLTKLTVQIAPDDRAQSVRFGITNFSFVGTEVSDHSDGSMHLLLPLVLKGDRGVTKLIVQPVEQYERIMTRVRTLKSIDVTSEVIGDILCDSDIERLTEVVDDLCYILSVARGTKIQWVYCDLYNANGERILRTHHPTITKSYGPLAIIDPRAVGREETKTFIESAYVSYVEKRESYKLNHGTIDAYLDAKAENDYIEMRAVKLAVEMEMLKAMFLELPDASMNEDIIDKVQFKDLVPTIRSRIDDVLQQANIEKNRRGAICSDNKILGLNRRSFAHLLRKICKKIGLDANGDIELFITCRNKLVHTGRFYCTVATPEERQECEPLPTPIHEYLLLVNFLDRVFLKLLGYSGAYIDWRLPNDPIRREHV